MMELYSVQTHYHIQILMRDGVLLSANLWLPVPNTPAERFPAILEMIPYRKDDWRYAADHQRMSWFAQRGYGCCRLDVRGTGSSGGIALDEYTLAETQDGYDVVEWLAAQPWCNGNVGMWGISYGGFTAIQVAKLQPPHLKAIIPVYATDDRYTDDVHYLGGCLLASDTAQYAVNMVAMNALPPKPEYAGPDWLEKWRERLDQTPPWFLTWLREQTDGPYWRSGSLTPDYERIACALFSIGGWHDGYTNAALRMHEKCVNAPRKTLIGNWVHSLPDHAYPGPNLDYLHEMERFFAYWLKGINNGVMAEPPFTFFRREYTPPQAFPAQLNGTWQSAPNHPITQSQIFYLGVGPLQPTPSALQSTDHYPHQPTLGTCGSLSFGAGSPPFGLARDLRPDEARSLVYTSDPLTEPLDIFGFPEVILYLQSSAPVAHVVVRLANVAPDGTSELVSTGVLNLTHRNGYSHPAPLQPDAVYEICVPLKATGYRFLPGHRIRLSIASAYWPVVWPSPYPADNELHCGGATPSRLILPIIPSSVQLLPPPLFKSTPPELIEIGGSSEDPPVWQITEDVLQQSVTVRAAYGDTTLLPNGTSLYSSEAVTLTAHQQDPARAQMHNESIYCWQAGDQRVDIRSAGMIRSTEAAFVVELVLAVKYNGEPFFQKHWAEQIARGLL